MLQRGTWACMPCTCVVCGRDAISRQIDLCLCFLEERTPACAVVGLLSRKTLRDGPLAHGTPNRTTANPTRAVSIQTHRVVAKTKHDADATDMVNYPDTS